MSVKLIIPPKTSSKRIFPKNNNTPKLKIAHFHTSNRTVFFIISFWKCEYIAFLLLFLTTKQAAYCSK